MNSIAQKMGNRAESEEKEMEGDTQSLKRKRGRPTGRKGINQQHTTQSSNNPKKTKKK